MRMKIDERHNPEEDVCPGCALFDEVKLVIGTPLVSYSTNPGMTTSDSFNSRMQEIAKSKGQGHTIKTRRENL